MSKRLQVVLAVIAISSVWFGVRVSNVDSTMTTDESLWLGRSANFYQALARDEYQNTYQMAHPGVPVMWAGGLGVLAACPEYIHADGFYVRDLAHSSESFREVGCDPLQVLVAERIAKVAVQAVIIAASLLLLATFLPLSGVVFAGLLMAFSPWQAGLDQLLHVDGMFATASVLTFSAAAAMTMWSIRTSNRSRMKEAIGWFGVGIALALAVLVRSAAVVYLLPIGLGALIAATGVGRSGWRSRISGAVVKRAIISGISVVLGGVAGVFAMFPALWADPVDVAARLFGFTDTAITEGHEHPLYYNGEIVAGDPGPLFYPDAFMWRSTPTEWIVLAGVTVIGILWIALPRLRRANNDGHEQSQIWIALAMAAIFVLVYGAGITIAAKKFERYFIMASPFLAVAGGLVLPEMLRRIKRPIVHRSVSVVLVVLMIMQVLSLSSSRPYMIDYFNPVVGGHDASATKFPIGWGHGGDHVAEWLVSETGGEPARVRASTTIGVFSVFVPTESRVGFERGDIDTIAAWYHIDYYVSGLQQAQRDLDRSLHMFEGQEPVHTVELGNITYFEIYEVNSQPVPDLIWQNSDCRHITASGVQLMRVEQRGDDVLLIVRIDDQSLARDAWISIDSTYDRRLPVNPTGDGMLVGVKVEDSSVQDIQVIAIGGPSEALSYEFPSGACRPVG